MITAMQIIVFLLVLTILYVPYCRGHAYVIMDRLSRKPAHIVSENYHALWHEAFGHFRIALHLAIGFAIFMHSNDLWLAVKFTAIGTAYAMLIYDSLLNYFRDLPVIPFVNTCDGDWDFDCFYVWLRKRGVNHLVFKTIILSITIILSVTL